YVKFKSYLEDGYFVQIRGLVQERFRQVGNWGFELKSIQLLSELRDKFAKNFTIQIALHQLNDDMIHKIHDLVESTVTEGEVANCSLKFMVVDVKENIAVEMPAKSRKIKITNELLETIEEMEGVKYKLN
ncbi:MAG: DNA polymerase III subunit alpha, partial [Sphingobacterium composti]